MRLIDADALKEQLSKETNIKSLGLWLNILQIIDNAPTVELPVARYDGRACAESVSGTWKYKGYNYYCSNCGNGALEQEEYPYLSAYCPFCGAKMEIEQ